MVPAIALSGNAEEMATIELRPADAAYVADATVEAVRQAVIAAQVAGRVLETRVDAGVTVKQGQLLMRLDGREASESQAAATAQLEQSRLQFDRMRELQTKKFVSQAAVDKAEADFKSARAGSGQAGAAVSHSVITAPIGGVIGQRFVETGEMAEPGRPLISVFDPRSLRVLASIPQYRLEAVRRAKSARIEFPESGKWIDSARIEILPTVDPRTRTAVARVYLPEFPPSVVPGMFARVHFLLGKTEKMGVPAAALVRRGEITAVYVIDAQGQPRLRQVRLGEPLENGYIEVLAGLSPGERIATDPRQAGMAAVKAQSRVTKP